MFCFKLQEVKTSDLFVGDERNISLTPITKKEGVHTFRLSPVIQRVVVVIPPSSEVKKIFGV